MNACYRPGTIQNARITTKRTDWDLGLTSSQPRGRHKQESNSHKVNTKLQTVLDFVRNTGNNANVKQGTWHSLGDEIRLPGTENCMCKGPEALWLKSWKGLRGATILPGCRQQLERARASLVELAGRTLGMSLASV